MSKVIIKLLSRLILGSHKVDVQPDRIYFVTTPNLKVLAWVNAVKGLPLKQRGKKPSVRISDRVKLRCILYGAFMYRKLRCLDNLQVLALFEVHIPPDMSRVIQYF